MEPVIVLLFALERESVPLRRRLGPARCFANQHYRSFLYEALPQPLLLVETGVGVRRSEAALASLLGPGGGPTLVLNCGFAGALHDNLQVGDIVVATEVIDATTAERYLPTRLGITRTERCEHAGRVLCSSSMICDPVEKRRLGQEYRALAVDMESAAVARFCTQQQIPFACVRAISDTVHTPLSTSLASLLSGGQTPLAKLILALLRSPRLLPEMLRLAADTALASERLANLLIRLSTRVPDGGLLERWRRSA
jgi:nucleoside phosphorylase